MPRIKKMAHKKRKGFTLVEIMVAVVIIGLLLLIAIPAFVNSRMRSQNARLASDLRVFAGLAETFALENGQYPEDSSSGDIPTGFETYIRPGQWYEGPSIGGEFDMEKNSYGVTSAVGVVEFTVDNTQLMKFEQRFDDGNFATGQYRLLTGSRFYRIVAD